MLHKSNLNWLDKNVQLRWMSQRKAEKEHCMNLEHFYGCEHQNCGRAFSLVGGNKGQGNWPPLSSTQSVSTANSFEL